MVVRVTLIGVQVAAAVRLAMAARAARSLTRPVTMAAAAVGAELLLRAGMVKLRPKVELAAPAAFAVAVLVGVTGTPATTHLVQAAAAGELVAISPHIHLGVFGLVTAGRTAARVTSAAAAAAAPAMAETAVSAAAVAAETRTTFTCQAGTAALAVVVEA